MLLTKVLPLICECATLSRIDCRFLKYFLPFKVHVDIVGCGRRGTRAFSSHASLHKYLISLPWAECALQLGICPLSITVFSKSLLVISLLWIVPRIFKNMLKNKSIDNAYSPKCSLQFLMAQSCENPGWESTIINPYWTLQLPEMDWFNWYQCLNCYYRVQVYQAPQHWFAVQLWQRYMLMDWNSARCVDSIFTNVCLFIHHITILFA